MAVIQQSSRADHDHTPPHPGPMSRDCPPDYRDYLTMAVDRTHLARPATPDRVSRSSFSSIRENESVLPQDFSHSKVSSFLTNDEAISDDGEHADAPAPSRPEPAPSAGHFNMIQTQFQPPTAAERLKARNLTSETLLQCLNLTPALQEFLAQEYIDDDLSADVLKKLFLGLENIKAVDFCGCTSLKFREAFTKVVSEEWPSIPSLERVSFHKCMTLPSAVYERILPSLPRLTHLDVAGTRITDAALMSIPHSARLTHLNLAKCKLLSAKTVLEFLSSHPAAKNLVFLSVATDARTDQLLGPEDISQLLPVLPRSLKSLSLKGAKMDDSHMDLLRPLTKHLEELAIGRGVKLQQVNRLFVPDETDDDDMQLDWVPHTLKFLDLSDMWSGELDLTYLFGNECAVLKSFSEPLTVVELAEDVFKRVNKSMTVLERVGWRTSECGVRGWMVRNTVSGQPRDDGRRKWKMGAESWGMRKIPVAVVDVGGMYGSFMFGRKL